MTKDIALLSVSRKVVLNISKQAIVKKKETMQNLFTPWQCQLRSSQKWQRNNAVSMPGNAHKRWSTSREIGTRSRQLEKREGGGGIFFSFTDKRENARTREVFWSKAARSIARLGFGSTHDVGDADERKGNKDPDGIPQGLDAYRRGRFQLPCEARREGEREKVGERREREQQRAAC